MVSWLWWSARFFLACSRTSFTILTLQSYFAFCTLYLCTILLCYCWKYFFRQINVRQITSPCKFCAKFLNLPFGLFYFKKYSYFSFYIFSTRKLELKKNQRTIPLISYLLFVDFGAPRLLSTLLDVFYFCPNLCHHLVKKPVDLPHLKPMFRSHPTSL